MRSQRSCPQPRPTDRVNILSRSVFLCFYNGEEYQPPLPFLLHKGVARPISPLQYLRSRGIRCLVAQSCLTLCNPIRLLCLWTSPGKNTGVSCHALLRGIFLTQGQTCTAHISCIGRWVLHYQCPLGSPKWSTHCAK